MLRLDGGVGGVLDRAALDLLPHFDEALAAPEVDVGGGEAVQGAGFAVRSRREGPMESPFRQARGNPEAELARGPCGPRP